MIQLTKLTRGALLAVAVLAAAPFAGANVAIVGVQSVQAQEQLVASVLFEGNRRFSDAQLLDMVDVSATGLYTQQRLNSDIESIRRAYDDDGFTRVNVSARTEAVADGRVRVIFQVEEGDRAGVAAINFTGNNSISSGNLKGAIRTKETGILSWLVRDDTYSDQQIGIDRELIRLYYANRGFPDTQVNSVGEYDPQRNAYFINFTIDEGQRYQFGQVGIETSISGLNTDVLRNVVETREGTTYSISDLQETVQDMAYEATAQGYAFADVRPRIDRNPQTGTFDITYLVDEGPRVYVERINITGNEKTRDYVIRRELEFGEGDPFNRSMVIRGRQNIRDLGFFSDVNVTTQRGSAADQVVLNVAVVEQSTGQYGATAGYSTTDGILGEVSLTERNFLGRGQYLRVALGASESGRTFDFSFTEPRFMGLRVSSGVDVYHRIKDETDSSVYGYEATGGRLRFGVPITDTLSATAFVSGERKLIVDEDPDNSLLVDDGEEFYKASIGYTLTYDGVDNVEDPTEGLYATFSQEYIGIDHSLIKSEARARYFMPLLDDSGIVASVRGQAGVINDLSGDGVHVVEAFNPGSSLIRGFQSRGLGPRLANGEYVGSTMYAGLSAEVEFPIPALPENYGLSGAVWGDVAWVGGTPDLQGNILDPGSDNEPVRTSVGASLIWDSPFGPLRGDFAHVLNKSDSDRTQVFQLSLQTLL
ncbi:outer membrane protein assembly factor BamA [Devosia pacifica]|uniref:Outer membrane protein assembly factor BamA n=1 Tax=Devosia pacifica TaxID=1335967 RepID=A0A918VLB6_9HYPH|nr:outer membrane protein assembly factor BamA [Devosia pacifica]GHA10686.1 outer membrane protein assembly factor BamA [Devosia pacifica]